MANIDVVKLKIRRGLDSQRRLVILDEGELGYTIDTQRLYIGNGVTPGGLPGAPKIHAPLTNVSGLSNISPENGDIVYANNLLLQYVQSLSSWTFIGSTVDEGNITYDAGNNLTIALSSINGARLNQQQLSSTSIKFDSDSLVVNYNTSQFTISGNQFAIAADGIKPIHISTSSVSKGLVGGGGSPLSAAVDGTTISYDGSGNLTVISQPVSAVTYSKLSGGFEVDLITSRVSTLLRGVDSRNFALCSGIVTLNQGFSSQTELPFFNVDNSGIIQSTTSSIFDILSCNAAGGVFNGSPDQVTTGYTPSQGIITFTAISDAFAPGLSSTMTLSSAGFIVFKGGIPTRGNPNHTPGRFAIPVFTL